MRYIKGDATNPQGDGRKLIIHVCNDIGKWGAGFVLALDRRFGTGIGSPKVRYMNWYRGRNNYWPQHLKFRMGAVQIIQVADDIWLGNMIAQSGIRSNSNPAPIKYDALQTCLSTVCFHSKLEGFSVHAPRFGAGLAGGSWDKIEKMIQEELVDKGVSVTIYDLP